VECQGPGRKKRRNESKQGGEGRKSRKREREMGHIREELMREWIRIGTCWLVGEKKMWRVRLQA